MKILIACEFSGIVRDAFTAKGHNAWSCDLLPTERPGKHIQDNVQNVIGDNWDMIIAHPPCTDLSVSGARYFKDKKADGRQDYAIEFFMMFARSKCEKVCIENPVGIMSTAWRKPDQIIQPWMFGHPESKKTCLWLKGLPLLKPTNVLSVPESGYWNNQTPSGQNKLGPSPTRAMDRSRTYQGIADAMADQWAIEFLPFEK